MASEAATSSPTAGLPRKFAGCGGRERIFPCLQGDNPGQHEKKRPTLDGRLTVVYDMNVNYYKTGSREPTRKEHWRAGTRGAVSCWTGETADPLCARLTRT